MTRRKLTADERDRKIVAEAGPWQVEGVGFCLHAHDDGSRSAAYRCSRAARALARIANRIVKEEKP